MNTAVTKTVPKLHENDLVPPPRATRKAAKLAILVVIGLPIFLLLAPWRQNVAGRGRIMALDPIDRVQSIPAPVTGRVSQVLVREGERVKAGQIMIEMSDLDPNYALRLEQQVTLAREKREAARVSADLLKAQVASLGESRDLAVTVAQLELSMATQKVLAAKQFLLAARADRKQKVLDSERKQRLYAKKLTSQLKMQKAQANANSAIAKVEESEAKLQMAREQESAKKSSIEKTRTELQAKLEQASSKHQEAVAKAAAAEKDVQDALTKSGRQGTQRIVAPRDGMVSRIDGTTYSQLVKKGDVLLRFVPDSDELVVELWLEGNDAPLVSPGRSVRLQFEVWPAVQFVGWPSVARGTFGGLVAMVDAQDDGNGRFRLLVKPDPNDVAWPERRFLRRGVQVKGWVLLDEVKLGFEIWRQLNGFPPSLSTPPGTRDSKSGSGK